MSKPAYTHTVRVKGSDAKPEPATAEDVANMTKAFGERTVKTKYEVKLLADKPADLLTIEPAAKAPKGEAGK